MNGWLGVKDRPQSGQHDKSEWKSWPFLPTGITMSSEVDCCPLLHFFVFSSKASEPVCLCTLPTHSRPNRHNRDDDVFLLIFVPLDLYILWETTDAHRELVRRLIFLLFLLIVPTNAPRFIALSHCAKTMLLRRRIKDNRRKTYTDWHFARKSVPTFWWCDSEAEIKEL